MSRRFILSLVLMPAVLAGSSFAAEQAGVIRRVEAKKYAVVFYQDGAVEVLAGPKNQRVCMARLGDVTLPSEKIQARGPVRLSNEAGMVDTNDVVHVEHVATAVSKLQSAWPAVRVQGPADTDLSAVWTFLPESVHVVYTFPAGETLHKADALLPVRLDEHAKCVETIKPARWLQHPHGGEPYQQTAGMACRYERGPLSMVIAVDGGVSSVVENGSIHLQAKPFRRPWQTDKLEAAATFDFGKQPYTLQRAVALAGRDRILLNVRSPEPMYLWDSTDDPLSLQADVVNLSEKTERFDIEVIARTIDGEILLQDTQHRRLAPLKSWTVPVAIPVKQAGPVYVTLRASQPWQTTMQELCLGVLPDREFRDEENSRFGMAAHTTEAPFQTESRTEEEALQLMRRMGVRWLRMAIDRQLAHRMGMYTWYANGILGPDFSAYREGKPTWIDDPKNRENLLRGNLTTAKDNGDVVIEWTNEWNLFGGQGSGMLAERYVKDWLLPLCKLRNELAPKMKIGGAIIANGDLVYLQKMHQAGGWPAFDYLVFHAMGVPRSPDFDPGGEYWSYLATLRRMHEALRLYGDKPLWITEFYAPTLPNSSINHNERISSQNLTLEIALAVAADVKGMMYYRFNDADYGPEIHDPQTTSEPIHRETYFGLVRRDWCPKANVWAYQTAAWMFDGARFLGDAQLTEKDVHGLVFEGNQGKFAVLWSRKEGYQTPVPAHPRTGFRRPWQEHWTVRTPISLPAVGDSVTVIDWLGRERVIKAGADGKVCLELTGAPIYVLGADLQAASGKFSRMFK